MPSATGATRCAPSARAIPSGQTEPNSPRLITTSNVTSRVPRVTIGDKRHAVEQRARRGTVAPSAIFAPPAITWVNYGQLPRHLDETLASACPIVASYGGRDRSLRGAAARLDAAFEKAGVVHDVKEYPAASHAFLNDAETGPGRRVPCCGSPASAQSSSRPKTPGARSNDSSTPTSASNPRLIR